MLPPPVPGWPAGCASPALHPVAASGFLRLKSYGRQSWPLLPDQPPCSDPIPTPNDALRALFATVVIEHNMDVIKTADWIIDLGPEGGDGGGYIVAEGTPEQVAKVADSHTGTYLARVLKK